MAKHKREVGPSPTLAQEKVLRLLVHGDGRVRYGSSGYWYAEGFSDTFRYQHPVAMATLSRMERLGWLAVIPQPGERWTFQAPRKLTAAGRKALGRCPQVQTSKIDLPDRFFTTAE
jgi:hypothetical protein